MQETQENILAFFRKYYLPDDPEIAEKLAALAEIREYPAGETIFSSGDTMDEFCILYSGGTKIVYQPDADSRPLVMGMVYKPGVALLPVNLDRSPGMVFSTTVITTVPSSFIFLPFDKLLAMAAENQILLRLYINMQTNTVSFHATHSMLLRLYNNDLEGLYNYYTQHHPAMLANSSVEDIASWMGVSMYHLSRVRNQWKREHPEAYEKLRSYKLK